MHSKFQIKKSIEYLRFYDMMEIVYEFPMLTKISCRSFTQKVFK